MPNLLFSNLRFHFLIFILFSQINLLSQINFQDYFKDSLVANIDQNYSKLKQVYSLYNDSISIDPKVMEQVLEFSLRNNDTTFYFDALEKLSENFGFTFSNEENRILYEVVADKNLFKRSKAICAIGYNKYYESHPQSRTVNSLLNGCHKFDQSFRGFYGNLRHDQRWSDTIYSKLDELLYEVDRLNFYVMKEYCIKNKTFINNLDFGNSYYERFEFLLYHNIRHNENMMEVINFVNEYGSIAYKSNKINKSVFLMCDEFYSKISGYQCFGFLKNIKIDPDFIPLIKGPYFH
jgi:hypothetical protein